MSSSEDDGELYRSYNVKNLTQFFNRTLSGRNKSKQIDHYRPLVGRRLRKKATTDYNVVEVKL